MNQTVRNKLYYEWKTLLFPNNFEEEVKQKIMKCAEFSVE